MMWFKKNRSWIVRKKFNYLKYLLYEIKTFILIELRKKEMKIKDKQIKKLIIKGFEVTYFNLD